MKRKYKAIIRVDFAADDVHKLGPEYFECDPAFKPMWGDGNDSFGAGYRWTCVEVEIDEEES
jgi:hypothetical protein